MCHFTEADRIFVKSMSIAAPIPRKPLPATQRDLFFGQPPCISDRDYRFKRTFARYKQGLRSCPHYRCPSAYCARIPGGAGLAKVMAVYRGLSPKDQRRLFHALCGSPSDKPVADAVLDEVLSAVGELPPEKRELLQRALRAAHLADDDDGESGGHTCLTFGT